MPCALVIIAAAQVGGIDQGRAGRHSTSSRTRQRPPAECCRLERVDGGKVGRRSPRHVGVAGGIHGDAVGLIIMLPPR